MLWHISIFETIYLFIYLHTTKLYLFRCVFWQRWTIQILSGKKLNKGFSCFPLCLYINILSCLTFHENTQKKVFNWGFDHQKHNPSPTHLPRNICGQKLLKISFQKEAVLLCGQTSVFSLVFPIPLSTYKVSDRIRSLLKVNCLKEYYTNCVKMRKTILKVI